MFRLYKNQATFRFFVFTIILLATVGVNHLSAGAQEPLEWTPPQRIPGYDVLTKSPYLVADQNRTVHAFTSQWVGSDEWRELVVFYNQWTLEQGWTEPIDILLPSLATQARLHGAYLDQDGMMHVVFFGGADLKANIYYSKAPGAIAGQAQAWTQPVLVGEKAITPDTAAFAGDDKGNLFIIYSGNRDGNGLYAVHSSDGGNTWSDPINIFLTFGREIWPTALQAYMDKQGTPHVVWSTVDISGNGLEIYYTQFGSERAEWREPILLAETIGFEADTPNLIEYNNELFVIYHNDFPTTRWMRRSRDGGRTWSPPLRLFPHVGSNGAASLVVDSNNVLRMFFGNRVGNPATHGMWHSVWRGGGWSPPNTVISGPLFRDNNDGGGGNGFDPSFAKAIVIQGNTILLTWTTDPAAGFNGVWYSYARIEDAPELPVVQLPTPPATATPVPIATSTVSTPTPTPSPRPQFTDDQIDSSSEFSNPALPLAFGIGPVILLTLVIIIFYSLNRTYRG